MDRACRQGAVAIPCRAVLRTAAKLTTQITVRGLHGHKHPVVDIDPVNRAAPRGPQRSGRSCALRQRCPPLARRCHPASDIISSVRIEVADLHVDPGYAWVPPGPEEI